MRKRLYAFVEYAGERAVKTIAQSALAMITASTAVGLLDVDWVQVASVSILAGVLSVLTSVAFPTKEGVSPVKPEVSE
jgi:hypothetical protein